jgi:mycothiol synthase
VLAVVETRIEAPLSNTDLVAVTRLHDAAEAADGHPALNDAVWRDLDRPRADDSASVVATTVPGGPPAGFAHVARSDTFSPPHWAVGIVVAPDARDGPVARALLDRAAEHVAGHGGGTAVLWLLNPDDALDAAATAAGFHRQRELLRQRVALPVREEPRWPDGITVRAFAPGQDDAAWLEVNNRAFANHPEQGGWVEGTLRRRQEEPWFDPAGFLLALDADGLAGFCWTKVHPATDDEPEQGEIFVIGVDPDRQGTGLGRALVLGGLAHLAGRGIGTGILYVDGANTGAVRLYEAIGFRTDRVDRAYAREVPPG